MPQTNTLLSNAIRSRANNFSGAPRQIGIEIEFAGLSSDLILEQMRQEIGGDVHWESPFEVMLRNQQLGEFRLELDSKQIKELGVESPIKGDPSKAEPSVHKAYIEMISKLAENLVPWEIVSPPLQLAEIERLYPLIDRLRNVGALGTKASMRYAFGVHLNPEPISLDVDHLVNHMKSFFCLYDWIITIGEVDLARRITPYINHFDKDYILQVLHKDYRPDMTQFIEDYLKANPTRNRSLDMLPMFAHLNDDLVRRYVDDDRVKARPTFHYRLPNCEIDNPDWNLHRSVELWMAVEELALADELQSVCDEYAATLSRLLPQGKSAWVKTVTQMIELPTAESFKTSLR